MKKIKYALIGLLSILLLSSTATIYAKPRLDTLKNGGYVELSNEDMCDTVSALITKIAKEQHLATIPEVSCFDWAESPMLAYNTNITHTICVNMAHFRDSTDAALENETVEYHLVKTLAHEVRHSYQWDHQFDDSDYGRACLANFQNYITFDGYNLSDYNGQFLESDAISYGRDYADKFCKEKSNENKKK